MNPFLHLALAIAVFVALHFVTSTPLRSLLVARLGERRYLGIYSLTALITLGWTIWAYAHTPIQALWVGWRHLPIYVMPFSILLLVSGYLSRNPTMVMQEGALKAAEPARGALRVTRHPLMWAIILWAGSHILARGDLRSMIFFGGFLALALLGTVSMDRRKRAALGEDWKRFADVTSNVPFVAILQGRNRFIWSEWGYRNPAIAFVVFIALLLMHPWLFGVRPY